MSTILACTDGSIYAPSVYQHAAWAATRLDAAVQVLHVLDPHRERTQITDYSGSLGFDASAELLAELAQLDETHSRIARLKGEAVLEDARKQLTGAGVAHVSTLQRHGALVETLEEFEPASELVVIGKRGEHADFAKGHLGGNLQRVIRSSVRPVLVASRAFKPMQRFLIAYDGGPSVSKAVDFVIASPLLKGLQCHILRAGHVDDKASWYLEEAAARLREVGYDVTANARPGSPEDVISEVVKADAIDLLVMGAYGHSPIRQFILGSTTTTMVRTCQIPVLMFR